MKLRAMRDFTSLFKSLTDHSPFAWQERLFKDLVENRITHSCNIPTGLGKTSVIPIWLVALVTQIDRGYEQMLPRRLIYIVNRRTVVDQATDIVVEMRDRIKEPDKQKWKEHHSTLSFIKETLIGMSVVNDIPLAISTLRGEMADNEEWKADPSCPAIIVGTVDMIGSKLLFSGYGDGFRIRPHHAGLIGQDSLIVHDEAHLTPTFGQLLDKISAVQQNEGERKEDKLRPIKIIELSATPQKNLISEKSFSLTNEDEQDEEVKKRLNAPKLLHYEIEDNKKIEEKIAALASKYESENVKVLIYVHSPESAKTVVSQLKKIINQNTIDGRISLLTGTMRGYERDQLVQSDSVYKAFLDHDREVEQSCYLVSTSAGEVGVDFDADHMVCDLTTLDSMIQRFGRVNRKGNKHSNIDVVFPDKIDDKKPEIKNTKEILERLEKDENGEINVNPKVLMDILSQENVQKAFNSAPHVQPLTDIVLDYWSLTSIKDELPGRPEIASFLHGLTNDLPETYVIWREEVKHFVDYDVPDESIEEWFQERRIESHERLRDWSDRVYRELQKIGKKSKEENFRVVVLSGDGKAEKISLNALLKKKKEFIAFRTIVLPAEAGGITKEGILDGNQKDPALDVASIERPIKIVSDLNGEEVPSKPKESLKLTYFLPLKEAESEDEEEESKYLVLFKKAEQFSFENPKKCVAIAPPTLSQHIKQVAAMEEKIVQKVGIPENIKEALILAAEWHDKGKDRLIWQEAIYNKNGEPLAKSRKKVMDWRLLGGYRHEFGSLLDASGDPDIDKHPEKDLILHLIAAHHGWARPNFNLNAFDTQNYTTNENEKAAQEVMRRFGRLQLRFGRWGLAWLESLLRCADYAVSKEETTINNVSTMPENPQ